MRIAAFNVENLFDRARALNSDAWMDEPGANPSRWSAGRKVLDSFATLNALLREATYTPAVKRGIVEQLTELGLVRSDESTFVILRRNRGTLLRRPRTGGVEIVAEGRDDWIGWLELKTEPVNEIATQNTARILNEVDADIVVVVEAENRISLNRFNKQLLPLVGGQAYPHVMVIDGNDERGIDVGLMSRAGLPIGTVRSHVDDQGTSGPVFSRDCPEFHMELPSGKRLVILANHFKSKGFGGAAASNARRLAQATRVFEIYQRLLAEGHEHVAIGGDLNDTPDSAPLAPLLGPGSDLRDISAHPTFQADGRIGTFGNGNKGDKIDYLLLSPALFATVQAGGVNRRGVWGGKNGTLWPILPEMTNAAQAASDHAAIWADIDL